MRERDWDRFNGNLYRPAMPILPDVYESAKQLLSSLARGVGGKGKRDREMTRLSAPVLDELWETLCLRFDAMDLYSGDGKRSFAPYIPLRWMHQHDRRDPGQAGAPKAISDRPDNVETMVAVIAMGPQEMATVELIAMEAATRMVPWGVAAPRRVVWTIEDGSLPAQSTGTSVFSWPTIAAYAQTTLPTKEDMRNGIHTGLSAEIMRSKEASAAFRDLVAFERSIYALNPSHASVINEAQGDVRGWCRWRIAASLSKTISKKDTESYHGSVFYPQSMVGVRFDDLPDALDAVLRIWNLGCELLDVRGDAVIVRLPVNIKPITATSFDDLRRASVQKHRDEIVYWRNPNMATSQPSL